jgi:hypothetical protein
VATSSSSAETKEKERIMETLKKYEFVAPSDGGSLQFVGDEDAARVAALEQLEDFDERTEFPDVGDDNVEEVEEEGGEDDDDDDDDDETARRRKDLEARMAGLNIEEAEFEDMWERLNSREREEFVELARELEKSELENQNK